MGFFVVEYEIEKIKIANQHCKKFQKISLQFVRDHSDLY